MRPGTPQRMLAIVGGAFLIGTGQSLIDGPITLGPANITTGTKGVTSDPNRNRDGNASDSPIPEVVSSETTTPEVDPDPVPAVIERIPLDDAEEAIEGLNTDEPTATFTVTLDPLLDAPVPEGTLSLRESKQLWDEGAYFIDARYEEEFVAGHIQYANLLPAQMFDEDSSRAFAITDTIPTDGTIVLYCVGGECDASKNTAAMLELLGYTDLRIMGAGYGDWVQAGFPIGTGLDGSGSGSGSGSGEEGGTP